MFEDENETERHTYCRAIDNTHNRNVFEMRSCVLFSLSHSGVHEADARYKRSVCN